ncbi:MAG TPA: glycosyltransferase family 9 protein [Usitatibacter sp.]|jgi:ADP-heptose:LPS heptosyltransferase|nr:glycosyltransferase family 9 protein [Usitatibacter sp.]
MGERFRTRSLVVSRAFAQRSVLTPAPARPRTALVAHNLLLGDTLMLTGLVAKLAIQGVQVTLLASPAAAPLYARRPYGVRVLPFRPADSATTAALLGEGPFDLAVVPGDNRYSWLAAAMGAAHIVAHAGDRPWTKDWFVDGARPYPGQPSTWTDMVAALVEGADPRPYARGDWAAPPFTPFEAPQGPYAVLHVGASTPLKRWPAERWNALAGALEARGVAPVWSAGRGEEALVAEADPARRYRSFAGVLDLPQLWKLLAHARLLVAPDTGVAHLGRVAWTPTLAIFGPGSAVICGNGGFWRDTPWRAVTREAFPCRDQRVLFRREIEWVRRCGRSTRECDRPRCMEAVSLGEVLDAAAALTGIAR